MSVFPVPMLASLRGAGGPSIALVQQSVGSAADGSSPVTVNFDVPVTAGNSVMCQIAFDPSKAAFSQPPILVNDDSSILAPGVANEAANNIWMYNYWVTVPAAEGTGVTFTLDTAVPVACNISEWSGLADAGPEDTETEFETSPHPFIISLDPFSPNNLCLASYATVGDNYDSGPTNSWTRMTPANVTGIYLESAYVIQQAATAATTTWGLDSSVDWSSIGCAFGGS